MEESNIYTFSFDARVIQLDNLFHGMTLRFRYDCDGYVSYISATDRGCIYLTNSKLFWDEFWSFEEKNKSGGGVGYLRGLQFDVIKNNGMIYDSYTYVSGTLRYGGYTNYALK